MRCRALDLCRSVADIPEENLLKWDLAETSAKPGPYPEIRESDVFVVSSHRSHLLGGIEFFHLLGI